MVNSFQGNTHIEFGANRDLLTNVWSKLKNIFIAYDKNFMYTFTKFYGSESIPHAFYQPYSHSETFARMIYVTNRNFPCVKKLPETAWLQCTRNVKYLTSTNSTDLRRDNNIEWFLVIIKQFWGKPRNATDSSWNAQRY